MIVPIMTIASLLEGVNGARGSSTTSKEKIDDNIDEWCRREKAKNPIDEILCEKILSVMKDNEYYTATDIIIQILSAYNLTNSRLAYLLRSMVNDGKIERIEKNKKVLFIKI